MKIRTVLAIVFSISIVALGQKPNGAGQPSHESSAQQTVAMLLANNGQAPVPGFLQTLVSRLGDDAAVGVIQYLGERKMTASEDLTSPQEIRRILEIIRMAFAVPDPRNSDGRRVPKATLVLLKYLSCLPAASAEKDELEKTGKFVEQLKLMLLSHEGKKN